MSRSSIFAKSKFKQKLWLRRLSSPEFETPTPPREKGPSQEWSVTYVKSICGILKILEIVLSFVGFICAIVFPYQSYHGIGFTTFVCISGFLVAVASFVIHIINVIPEGAIVLYGIIELIVYGIYSLFFLIAGIVAAVIASEDWINKRPQSSSGAAAFFCFTCLVAWALDTFVQFMAWNKKRNEPSGDSGAPPTAASTTASDAPTY